MKRIMISLVILLTILTSSCDKEDGLEQSDCIEIFKNSNWTTEEFKSNYKIQLPNNYEGTGMVGFEGNIFNKSRVDNKVELTYSFCSPTYCSDFGNVLDINIPNSIIVKDKENNDVTLDSKKEFCLNGNVKGILYYNTKINSTGKYYIKQDSEYLDGLTIYFDNTEYQEVENIIKTITEN
jgi:hypothetical protein